MLFDLEMTYKWPCFTIKDRFSWGVYLHFWRIYGLKSQKLKRTSFGFLFLGYFQKNIFHFRPKMKKNVQAISVSYFQLFIRVLHFMRTTRNHIGNTNRLGSFRRYVFKKSSSQKLDFQESKSHFRFDTSQTTMSIVGGHLGFMNPKRGSVLKMIYLG